METDSGSDSESSSESGSFLDDGSSSETSDEDSDIEMVQSASRRRPHPSTSAGQNGKNTMETKLLEEIQKQLVAEPSLAEATMEKCKRACDMRDELLDKIDELGDRLPSNTLDQLIEELGGPDEVAVSECNLFKIK